MKTPEPVSKPASPPPEPAASAAGATRGFTDPRPEAKAHSSLSSETKTNPQTLPKTILDPSQDDTAEDAASSKDLPEVLAQACRKHGLGADAVSAVQQDVLEAVEAAIKVDELARQDERSALLEELQEQWGEQAQPALDAAAFAAQRFGMDDEDLEDLLDCGDPRQIIPALARAGQALRALDDDEAAPVGGDAGEMPGAGAQMTAEAAQVELSRLAADRDHRLAFLNRAHPGHAAAKAQRARLVAASQGVPSAGLLGGRALG